MSRASAAAVLLLATVALVVVLVSSPSHSGNGLAEEQELWNPATYYNVFGGDPAAGPSTATPGWDKAQIRLELHKVIQAVQSIQQVSTENAKEMRSNMNLLNNQQAIDVGSIQSASDNLNSYSSQQQDLWNQFEQSVQQANSKEQQDMQALQQSLLSTLAGIEQQASASVTSRAGALDGAQADVAAAKLVLAEISKAQQTVKDLQSISAQKYADINSAFKASADVRKSVESAIKTADNAVKTATNKAQTDIASIAKIVSDSRLSHADKFSQIGKRLDSVSSALDTLTAQQTKLHNDLVDAATVAQRNQQAAINAVSADSAASVNSAQTSISAQFASIQSGIQAIVDAVNNNNIEASTQTAITRLSDAAQSKKGNDAVQAAQISAAVDQIRSKLGEVSQVNADTLKQVTALKAVYDALKANATTEASNLISEVQDAFRTGAFAQTSQNSAAITAIRKDLTDLKTGSSDKLKTINDLVKQLGKTYDSQVSKLATETAAWTKNLASADDQFQKTIVPLQSQVNSISTGDAKMINQTEQLFDRVQQQMNDIENAMINLKRPEGKKGPKGDIGAKGVAGVMGPIGPPGKQGPTGKQGPEGVLGLEGPVGDIGAAGVEGKQGPAGPQGPEGPQGPQGPQGTAGARGPTGRNGNPGATGPAGAMGPAGEPGNPGPIGPVGPPGKSA